MDTILNAREILGMADECVSFEAIPNWLKVLITLNMVCLKPSSGLQLSWLDSGVTINYGSALYEQTLRPASFPRK